MSTTSEMLAQTLRYLREMEPYKRPRALLGDELRVSEGTIQNWEDPTKNLSYDILEQYELRFGVPSSLILCIAQVAAAAFEGSRKGDIRNRLDALSEYLALIANRIKLLDDQEGRDALTSYSGHPETVKRAIIHDLVTTILTRVKAREERRALFQRIDRQNRIKVGDRW